jgi:starch synthase
MKKILYVSAECRPFSGKSSLAEVTQSLPRVLSRDFDIRVVTPLYAGVGLDYYSQMEYIGKINVSLSWRVHECKVYSLTKDGVIYYFLKNDYYFGRANLYGYYDDEERFAFFARAVIESMKVTGFDPDIIHTNDWQSALVPVYMKLANHESEKPVQLFTIQHIARQGKCDEDMIEDLLGIHKGQLCILENSGKINFMKGAIVVCDRFNTVSRNYATELKSSAFAVGLESIISHNEGKFSGVLHGIDYEVYNPEKDKYLFYRYGAENSGLKLKNKLAVQKELCLKVSEEIPLIVVISKLVTNKGMDILKEAVFEILKNEVQFVMIGEGEERYENFFSNLQKIYPTKMRCMVMHSEAGAYRLFAAGDYMVLPSQVEPCGRSQMIALRYGASPIVRRIGGLADSVTDVSAGGNGYVFEEYSSAALLNAMQRAVKDYSDKSARAELVKKSMAADFSWESAAEGYKKIYEEMT